MKKIYLALIALSTVSTAISQMGQIQNGGFENWTNTTLYDYPTIWGCSNQDHFSGVATAFKSTDAQIGMYSAEIRSVAVGPLPDTTFGYVFHGTVGAGGPNGGIPFTANFNTIKFQYKCDLPNTGDSVSVYVIRFVAGSMVDFTAVNACGGTHNAWTQGSVTIPSIPQEEIFLGFVMGDPMNNVNAAPGSWARFDNVQIYNGATATTNVPDPSFESWATMTTETPDNWFSTDPLYAATGQENAIKTTDFHSGAYAIEMSTLQDPVSLDTLRSFISAGPINFGSMNPFDAIPYNANPTIFSCFYKYAPSGMDQGAIQIQFFQSGIEIGNMVVPFTPNPTWTSVLQPLSIFGTPDSMIFIAFSGNNPGSVLTLDDLSLSGGNVGLAEFANIEASIYPNPASSVVMIKSDGVYSFEMVTMTGAVVRSASNLIGAQEINLSNVTPGTYFIRINNANASEVHKLIVE